MSLREEVRCLERLGEGKEMGETMQIHAIFQRKKNLFESKVLREAPYSVTFALVSSNSEILNLLTSGWIMTWKPKLR